MCMVYSNGRDDFVCSQDRKGKVHAAQVGAKKVAIGQEVHQEGQVALVSKTSYLLFEFCLP